MPENKPNNLISSTSEKKSESVGRTIARGVVISGGTNVALRFLEAAVAVLLLSWLPIFQYGAYQLTLSAFELFAGFFFAGLASVIVADVSHETHLENKEKANILFGAYAYFQFFISVLLWAFFFLWRRFIDVLGRGRGRACSYRLLSFSGKSGGTASGASFADTT